MKAEMSVKQPENIEMELTVSMTLGQWKNLRNQISKDDYPSWEFGSKITDMILHAEKHFYANED